MRNHLVRGKNIENNEWVQGYLYKEFPPLQCIKSKKEEPVKHFIIYAGFADWNLPRPIYHAEVKPETVGEYTGMCDIKNVEACEMDIIDTPAGKAIIQFGQYTNPFEAESYHVGFFVSFIEEETRAINRKDLGYWLPKSKIIGNTIDNMEFYSQLS